MRVPVSWLGEHVPLPAGVRGQEIADALVRVGLEEEAVHGAGITGPLVVGRVLEFVEEPQRNGKVIRWCQVDVAGDGSQPRGIVCGARNFAAGDLVVVSLPGAVLPGGFAISARKTYGHVSDGMICSATELGLGDDHDGILRLAEVGFGDAEVGADALALLGLGEEVVEVNVTPDRGYCFSIRGVAREYSHATGVPFDDPAVGGPPLPDAAPRIPVTLADGAPLRGREGCGRYVALVLEGVDASAPSPPELRRRLEQCGMRPISLAVDVTNYVMLWLGQPLHAFDLGTLEKAVVVRRARPGETLTTLDGVERRLHEEDLVVADGPDGGRALALAGVMGGSESEVSASTGAILLEAASFDPISVARTARRHRLSSEASRRFERGVDPALPPVAAAWAARLLLEHGGGRVTGVTDVGAEPGTRAVRMPWTFPNRLAGTSWGRDEVVEALERIGCQVQGEGETLDVRVPTWRPDLLAPVDLVEEVARLRGYESIPSVLPPAPPGGGLTASQRARRSVARALADLGLVEVLSYPFVSPAVHDAFGLAAEDPRRRALRVANPLSETQPEFRTSLLPPLLETLRRNVGRGITDLGLYEIGLVVRPAAGGAEAPRPEGGAVPPAEVLQQVRDAVPHQPRRLAVVMTGYRELPSWEGPGRRASWADAVAVVRRVAATLGVSLEVTADEHAPWHPGRCARITTTGGVLVGHAGELHPATLASLELPARTVALEVDLDVLLAARPASVTAAPVSTFPAAKEDVALVVPDDVPAAAVERALTQGAGDLLESARLFDVYTGPPVPDGMRSLAFALRLRAPDRTLTAEETAAVRERAVAAAAAATGAVLRGAAAG